MKAEGLIHKDVGHCCNKNLRDFLRSHSASSTSNQVQRRMQSILKQQQKTTPSPSFPSIVNEEDNWSSVLQHGLDPSLSLEDEIHTLMRDPLDGEELDEVASVRFRLLHRFLVDRKHTHTHTHKQVTSYSSDEVNSTTNDASDERWNVR